MPRSAVLNLRIEPEVKADAEKLFGSFGLTVTDAVNVFLRQSIMIGGFPFELVQQRPNMVIQTAEASSGRPPFEFGCMNGQIWMSDDFDAPLEDFQEYME